MLTAESYPLSPVINQAFAESKTLVEELDLDETNDPALMMTALSRAMLTDGKTLDQIVAPEVYAELKRRAEQTGLPMVALQRMKPWLVAITLMARRCRRRAQARARSRSAFFRVGRDTGMSAGPRDPRVSTRSIDQPRRRCRRSAEETRDDLEPRCRREEMAERGHR